MEDTNINLQIKFSKKTLIWFIILLLTIIFAGLDIKYRLINQAIAYYNRATATIIIVDKSTKKPLTGVAVLSNDITGQTDTSGSVTLEKLLKGTNDFEISKNGYVASSITATLAKGANDLGTIEQEEKKNLAKITGKIEDSITKKPVVKALIGISDATGNSTAEGAFDIGQATIQKTKIKITVAGYLDYEKDVEIEEKTMDLGTISLIPRGQLIFTSDRDGTSAIYSSNLDGSAAEKLIDNIDDQSEGDGGFGSSSTFWISPDAKHLAYTTNSEKNDSDKPKFLYVSTIKGKEIKKISEDINPYNIKWVNNSKIVYTVSSTKDSVGHLKTADIVTGIAAQLDEAVSGATNVYLGSVDVSSKGQLAYAITYAGAIDKSGSYLIDADGSNRQKVTDKRCDYNMTFFPDGKTLYCEYYDDGIKKYQINISTLEMKEGSYPFSKYGTKISPDGKKVLFVDNRDGQSNLFVKDVDGTNEEQLTTEGSVQSGIWSASGNMIAYITGKDGMFAKAISAIGGGEGVKITSCNGSSLALIDN